MTKRVPIENADTTDVGVIVEVWDKGVVVAPDTLAFTRELLRPADMTDSDLYLWSTRYIVIREK